MKILEYIKLYFKNKIKIKGKNNKIILEKSKVKENIIKIDGNENYLKISKGVKIKNTKIFIKGNNIKFILRENINIEDSFIEIYGDKNKVLIGRGTSFSEVRLTSAEEENRIFNCMFSYNIDLRNTDSHQIYKDSVLINQGKKVVIKDRVWVGAGVNILKGVFINSNNIIGAGSLINKSIFEKNVIIAGNPARVIKKDIEWKR